MTMVTKRLVAGFLGSCLVAQSLLGNALSSAFRAEGSDLEYNLDRDEALQCYRRGVDADPGDPASYRAVAGTFFLAIAFHRGAVTMDDFLDEQVTRDTIDVPRPPAELRAGFRENAEHALALAEQQVRAHPTDAEAHYQMGQTIGLLASYLATVDGEVFRAFRFGRRAYEENSRTLELDPARKDAALIVGSYQYIVSTRSMPIRWFARIAGIVPNKLHGIQLIREAAQYPGENQVDAQLALALIYNREHQYGDALQVLSDLQARYPRNRLLWLEAGSTALRQRRFDEAERILDEGFAKLSRDPRPRAFGEDALWHFRRGAARVGLRRVSEAKSDLEAALTGEARNWVRGRAHSELGKLADLAGDRRAAVREYGVALQIGTTDADAPGIAEAKRLMDHPYR
jgi:hypothetical protein